MARSGWHKESARHSLAARGCSTRPQKHARASPARTRAADDDLYLHIVVEADTIMQGFMSEEHDPIILYRAYETIMQASHDGRIDIEGEMLSVLSEEQEKAHQKLKEITLKYLNEYENLLEATTEIKDEKRRKKLVDDIYNEAEKINNVRKSVDLKPREVMYASTRAEGEAEAAAERAMDEEYDRSHEIRDSYGGW